MAAARIEEVWEKSIVEVYTYRGYERRWVEPGSRVIVGSWRTRLFTQDEWHALFPPTHPEFQDQDQDQDWEEDL